MYNIASIAVFLYFLFWWTYKLASLPGLHGDEAWFALKGVEFNQSGIHELQGMNSYTGIFQSLFDSIFFKIFHIGIIEMRVTGVILNLSAIAILYSVFRSLRKPKTFIIFSLLLSQSALFLISPRVAWEVNTFTFFSIAVLFASAVRILTNNKRSNGLNHWLFLAANLFGSYNHIIFSCVSLSALCAYILWCIHSRSIIKRHFGILLFLNAGNVTALFVVMQANLFKSLQQQLWAPVLACLALIIEAFVLYHFTNKSSHTDIVPCKLNNNTSALATIVVHLIIAFCLASFMFYHGIALIDVFSNYRLLMHAYSYPVSPILETIMTTAAVVLMGSLAYCLANDLFSRKKSPVAFFIVIYMGALSFYTERTSFRYYLAISIILILYLAWRASTPGMRKQPLFAAATGMFLCLNLSLITIFRSDYKIKKALRFQIGNGQVETSAHFLPNQPLIDSLAQNKIGDIRYGSGRYFMEQPILFYKLLRPWNEQKEKSAAISYDYRGTGKDGFIFQTSTADNIPLPSK
ncbi:hypothetical protein [Niabella beijingensis]|uniref:hypothetical protein n=1 Tax=Niabella beijingensis TaxID=2872700 RepID=UPI0023E43FB3|nr:hypothetical protein [Niabella beijingensis]